MPRVKGPVVDRHAPHEELEQRVAELTVCIHLRRMARLRRDDLVTLVAEASAEPSARETIRELLGVSTKVAQALLDLPIGSLSRFEIDRLEGERTALVALLRDGRPNPLPRR